ncbi:MAG: hypothetical protein COB60_05700 [Flavobacteriaceae bacterium]|nr:MAG: hypothetical protein COB60_05700 [Flavobacteriaceae bacterium]
MNILFFKLAFRTILKNRLSAIINIVGFSIGMAACLFVFLFIKYETSFDTFYPNASKIYRVLSSTINNGNVSKSGFTWFPMAPDIKNEIAGVDKYCRVSGVKPTKVFIENEVQNIGKLRFVDANFFGFFDFKLKAGNPETALNSADKIVLTEKKAKQLFGDKNPLGATLLFNHKLVTVSGIAVNPPSNTHLVYDALISIKYIAQSDLFWKDYGGGITFLSYLQLSENVTSQQIERALPQFLFNKINKHWEDAGLILKASLQNIKEVHLSDNSFNYDCPTNRSKKSMYIIVSISALILLLASINYIILYTAQKITKTKEIKILKMFGASKFGLMAQTYLEVVIITTIASVLGIFLLLLGTPFLNKYLQTTLFIENNIVSAISFLGISILVVSFLVAYFSTQKFSFSKVNSNKKHGITIEKSKAQKGSVLISFQFTVVIVLLIAVLIIYKQNKLLLNTELGFDKENIMTLQTDEEFLNNELTQFKQELQQLSEIHSVSLSSQIIGTDITRNGYTINNEKEVAMLKVLYTDADFLKCFKINLLAGRNFKENNEFEKNTILINQQLAKKAGWEYPIDKQIYRNGELKVIGVVEDFNFASLENKIQPMLIMSNPEWDNWRYSVVNIRFQTSNIQGLMSEISNRWKSRFPETPVEISFLEDRLASNYIQQKAQQKMSIFFSLIGALIAIIGLLGLTIFSTRMRIKEIGIRKVNGASVFEIIQLVNKNFMKWVGLAFVLACPIAYYAMDTWLENFAYKTSISWWVFGLVGVCVIGIALLAVSWIGWRVAVSNPVEALRDE